MGWSPIRRIVKPVKKVIKKVVDPIVKMGEQFEDLAREGIEGVDKAIQNPYVRMVIGATIPGSKPWIDAYAKLDSGENLTAADYASLGLSGAEDFAKAEIPDEVKIGLKVGTRINAGEDPVDIFVDEYGDDYVADLKLDTKLDDTLRTYYGDDVADLLKENKNVIQLANDIVIRGKDPSEAIANIYGQDIVDYLGVGDAFGYAGLKTAVGLDKGLSSSDALLAGAEEYYKRGGELPDLNTVASLGGVKLPDIDFGDTGFIKDLYSGTLGKLPDFPDAPDLAFIEDYIRDYSPNIKNPIDYKSLDLNFGDIARSDIDLNKIAFGVDVGDFNIGDLPDIGVPNVNIADFTMPEFTSPTMPEIGDYDIPDLPSLDLPFGEPEVAQRRGGSIPILRGTDIPEEETDEQLKIDELLLADFSLRNPLLRG